MPAGIEFPAHFDRTTKIISGLAWLIPVTVAILLQSAMVALFVMGIGLLITALAYAYSVRGYTVEPGAVVVKRLIGDLRVSAGDVRELRTVTKDDVRGAIRLWGSSGLFGYYGTFRTSKLGMCRWYVTNRANMVVLVTGAQTTLFSPDDARRFTAAVRAVASPAGGATVQSSPRPWRTVIGAAAAVLLVGAFLAFALLYSPGPPSYTLTASALTIHDRFYPVTLDPGQVDVQDIQVVDLSRQSQWRPELRTNGFANSHYQAGWFRVANGQKVRLYRADGRQLVLLPPKGNGTPVLLQVRRPEEFLNQVRREWGR